MSLVIAHNAKFELGWMIRQGLDITDLLVWDTMIAEYVLAGNRPVALDLDSVLKSWDMEGKERVIDALMKGGVCPSDMPEHLLERRVLSDVRSTHALFLEQREEIRSKGLLPVMFTRCILTPVLAYIEREGMNLDPKRVAAEVKKQRQIKAQAQAAMAIMAGGINMNSRKQLGKFLYGELGFAEPRDRRGNILRTAAGQPKTDKATLEGLKATTEEQRSFVRLRAEYGKAESALSKSLEFFQGVCDEYDGRFMANFNQTVTKTHRLSSSGRRLPFRDGKDRGAQFQNLPREYKPLFVPREADRVICEADGSGLEFRIAADLAKDAQARRDILDPEHDVHSVTASVIKAKDQSAISKKERTDAKRHTFKPLFSTGKSGSHAEVRYYQWFKERYKGITDTQESWIADVLRNGQMRLPSGLIAYWNLTISSSGYIEGGNEVRNLPIQSFATADIIPISLTYTFWRARHAVDARLINTVHDSVVADVASKDVDKYRNLVVNCFLDDTYRYLDTVYKHKMFVPLGVGVTIGDHWGEGEESSYSKEFEA
jgi:DNA polymerase I-like protein with 3'-5' exonuclease and polymerase domains